jgi:hypothetical protein
MGQGTGFRRFDLRDEFSGPRCRGMDGLEVFRDLHPEKGTFLDTAGRKAFERVVTPTAGAMAASVSAGYTNSK